MDTPPAFQAALRAKILHSTFRVALHSFLIFYNINVLLKYDALGGKIRYQLLLLEYVINSEPARPNTQNTEMTGRHQNLNFLKNIENHGKMNLRESQGMKNRFSPPQAQKKTCHVIEYLVVRSTLLHFCISGGPSG